ncbi:dATP/dGTP diphosphohydrolase domain-containing protein [Aurantimonas sp. A2-1-M11]|uniref:dATP/dGTP diphosphohydrolase domain-containing protein n=1 Tax=Aurantimonas sp. A2-1-M11 TaxID=3113712 RepID=UPI003FA5B86F
MAWSRLRGALDRHMAAFDHGEDTDPETGLPHLAHAACCLTFLLSYQLRNVGEDDLPRNSQGSRDWQAAVSSALSKLPPKN